MLIGPCHYAFVIYHVNVSRFVICHISAKVHDAQRRRNQWWLPNLSTECRTHSCLNPKEVTSSCQNNQNRVCHPLPCLLGATGLRPAPELWHWRWVSTKTRWWLLPLPSLHELLLCVRMNLLSPFALETERENSSESG